LPTDGIQPISYKIKDKIYYKAHRIQRGSKIKNYLFYTPMEIKINQCPVYNPGSGRT